LLRLPAAFWSGVFTPKEPHNSGKPLYRHVPKAATL
jgi:hypothetical protein